MRLVGKRQVGNLLLAALKGMFMQGLGADFLIGNMRCKGGVFKWQLQVADGKWVLCFWSVLLVSKAACSLIRALFPALPSLLLSCSCGSRWTLLSNLASLCALDCNTFHNFPWPSCWPVSEQAVLTRSRHTRFSVSVSMDAEVAHGMLPLLDNFNTQMEIEIKE